MDHYKETADLYHRIAKIYQDKFMDLDLYNGTYDRFCDAVQQPNADIFEIGCGPGNISRYLLAKRPDFKLDAIDIAPKMIELAQANNPSANFSVMDCRQIEKIDKSYDGIVCGFCLPYLSKDDCRKLIADAAKLLRINGIMYLSFVDDDYSRSGYQYDSSGTQKYHFFYHEQGYLKNFIEDSNMKLLEVLSVPYPSGDKVASHLIFIAKK
ncbi:MAG TPA: class I SAM-dependent methyltransferase [Flavobacterium sp.]|jgi:SAM-dependent methyltransferase